MINSIWIIFTQIENNQFSFSPCVITPSTIIMFGVENTALVLSYTFLGDLYRAALERCTHKNSNSQCDPKRSYNYYNRSKFGTSHWSVLCVSLLKIAIFEKIKSNIFFLKPRERLDHNYGPPFLYHCWHRVSYFSSYFSVSCCHSLSHENEAESIY